MFVVVGSLDGVTYRAAGSGSAHYPDSKLEIRIREEDIFVKFSIDFERLKFVLKFLTKFPI